MLFTESEIVQKLVGALNEMPDSDVYVRGAGLNDGPGYDAQIEGRISRKPTTLMVEVKRQVYPRDVHQYLHTVRDTMKRAKIHFDETVLLLLAAQNISPGAKEILRREKCAYFDSGGSLFIAANGLLIDRERPPAPSEERVMRTLFNGTRARVLMTMLERPNEWINVKHLSADAKVSTATASEVLQALERHDWVMTEGAGPTKQRRLIRPGDVLDAWTKDVETRKPAKQRRYFVPYSVMDATYRLPQVFDKFQIEYELTGEAAAQHYSPWLTNISILRFRIVYSERLEEALSEMDAKPTTQGANVSMIEVGSPNDIARRTREGVLWYAHPIQVYLDLLRLEGRAKDAAKHLRETVIKF